MVKIDRTQKRKKFPVRLQIAADEWFIYTGPMRKARLRMLEHYAAGWYQGDEKYISQPINLIDRGVQIVGPFLISNDPKVLIDAKRDLKSLRPFARTLELALEHLFKEIKFSKRTLRPAVIESLFSMGIVKTSIMAAEEAEIADEIHEIGQPYSEVVDFEDYITDVSARHKDEAFFEGHFYRLPEEYVKTSGLFRHYDKVQADTPLYGNETRPERVSKRDHYGQSYSELQPTVLLMDLYLPKENIIVTLPPRGSGSKIMRTVEWDGPEGGPFDVLGYRYFPNSIIPIPPVFTWLDVNVVLNQLVTKMKAQALRAKKIVLYDLGAAQDMENVVKSGDGEVIGVRSTDQYKEIEFGGASETAFPFIQYLEQQYSITGGNLYTLGGRQVQAKTLGQEQMLQANASKQLEDMVLQVHQFTRSIVEKLAWFLWTDPLINVPVIKRVGDLEKEVFFSEEAREGDFFDYGFDIEPYSMARMDPEMRYQRLMQLISQLVLPTAQIAAQQGSMLNVDELVKEATRFLDVRNTDKWWTSSMPQEPAMNPYQPQQGTTGGKNEGQIDNRFFREKGDNASNLNNLTNQQTKQYNQSSAPAGATTKAG